MTEGEFNTMEKDILSSENVPEQEKVPNAFKNKGLKIKTPKFLDLFAKIKNSFLFFKNPKRLMTLTVVLIVLLTAIAATVLFLKKEKPVLVEQALPQEESPAPKVDSEALQFKLEVETYNSELDSLQKDANDLTFPAVNLKDVKF